MNWWHVVDGSKTYSVDLQLEIAHMFALLHVYVKPKQIRITSCTSPVSIFQSSFLQNSYFSNFYFLELCYLEF